MHYFCYCNINIRKQYNFQISLAKINYHVFVVIKLAMFDGVAAYVL